MQQQDDIQFHTKPPIRKHVATRPHLSFACPKPCSSLVILVNRRPCQAQVRYPVVRSKPSCSSSCNSLRPTNSVTYETAAATKAPAVSS